MTTKYRDRGINDDSSMADSYRRNASLVLKLSFGEDYYVSVRNYGTRGGSYTLVVEPNQDKMLRSTYAYNEWNCDKLSNNTFRLGMWVSSKQYLNAEEVIMFCWALDSACQAFVGYDIDYVYNLYNEDVQKGIDLIIYIAGVLCCNANPSLSKTVSTIGAIFGYAYSKSNNDPYSMLQLLHNSCGVTYNGTNCTIKSGLVIN